jgi:hypothetical protein
MLHGSVFLCSMASARQQKILERVSTHLKSKGRCVTTLPAKRFAAE